MKQRSTLFYLILLIVNASYQTSAVSITKQPSANFNERIDKKTGQLIRTPQFIILHYTANCYLSKTIKMFLNYAKPVSAHYVIGANGSIVQMIDESKRAWHAGIGSWNKNNQLNTYSIGIEITNPGYTEKKTNPCSIFDPAIWNETTNQQVTGSLFYWQPFTTQQIDSVISLCSEIVQRYNIPPHHIVGHSDIAPGRKLDPGPLFPWKKLAEHGIGLWSRNVEITPTQSILDIQKNLQILGYKIRLSGKLDTHAVTVLQAFQAHFRPNNIDGIPDQETAQILTNLVQQINHYPS